VTNVIRFIDRLDPKAALDVDVSSKKWKNTFFELFGTNMTSGIVESEHRSSLTPLKGEFDLILDNKIIDYKTGKPLGISEMARKMDLKKNEDYIELQPFVYLSILDDISDVPGRREFIQFYALDNETDSFDEGFDITRNMRTVTLLDIRKTEIIRSGMLLDLVTRTKSRESVRDIGKGFNDALLKAGVENASEWVNDDNLFETICSLQEKRTKGAREAIRSAIKTAGKYMSGCFIEDGGRILIPRDSIEKFKEYVKRLHSKASKELVAGFPYEPRRKCRKCGYFHMCTGGFDDDAE
jgi:hypothetical protein